MDGSAVGEASHLALFYLVDVKVLRNGVEVTAHFLHSLTNTVSVGLVAPTCESMARICCVFAVFEVYDCFEFLLLLGVQNVSQDLSGLRKCFRLRYGHLSH